MSPIRKRDRLPLAFKKLVEKALSKPNVPPTKARTPELETLLRKYKKLKQREASAKEKALPKRRRGHV